jgi:hypothetical protein
VQLAGGVFGIYRVASRADAFAQAGIERVAERASAEAGQAVALFYDNSCRIRAGVLYVDGRRGREFGDGDTWWVPYGQDGALVLDGPRFRIAELRPDEEYDCVHTAIDAALEAIGVEPEVSAAVVKQAFCYDEAVLLGESGFQA